MKDSSIICFNNSTDLQTAYLKLED